MIEMNISNIFYNSYSKCDKVALESLLKIESSPRDPALADFQVRTVVGEAGVLDAEVFEAILIRHGLTNKWAAFQPRIRSSNCGF
jgi:hypothetical protein